MPRRREPAQAPLPLPCRLMGVLRAVVQALTLSMLDARQHVVSRRPVAGELVGDHHPRDVSQPGEQLPEEARGGARIAPRLPEDIEHRALVTARPPQGVCPAADAQEHLVEVPRVPRSGSPTAHRVGLRLAELQAPPADRLVGDDRPPLGQQFLRVAVAAREVEVAPDGVADDLGREAVTGVGGRRNFISQAGSIARRRRSIAS